MGLGHGDTKHKLIPTLVLAERVVGAKIVMVAAGQDHSMAATADGDAYTWGDGEEGALGHNDEDDKLVPTKLDHTLFRGSRVMEVAARALHRVAVTAEGKFFSWGYGGCGQLGLNPMGNRLNILTPTCVSNVFDGSRVLMVACGLFHTLFVTDACTLWSCGREVDGTLGHKDNIDTRIPTRVDSQHFDSSKIVTAAAGYLVSTTVTEDGAL